MLKIFTKAAGALARLHTANVTIGTLTDGGYDAAREFVPERVISAGVDPVILKMSADGRGIYEKSRTARIYIDADEELDASSAVLIGDTVYRIVSVERGKLSTALELEKDEWI